jgi:hypothetical protein
MDWTLWEGFFEFPDLSFPKLGLGSDAQGPNCVRYTPHRDERRFSKSIHALKLLHQSTHYFSLPLSTAPITSTKPPILQSIDFGITFIACLTPRSPKISSVPPRIASNL